MDPNPFARLRTHFLKTPAQKAGAVLASLGSAVLLALLLLMVYLFCDLLVTRGEVPAYSRLTPAQKQEFAAEWARRPEDARADAVRRLGVPEARARVIAAPTDGNSPPTAEDWLFRWRAGVFLALKERVGPAAADAYLPDVTAEFADPYAVPRLGVLPLVVRERNRWTGAPLGYLAAWNPWMWRPGESGDPNPRYLAVLFVVAFVLAFARGVLMNLAAYLAATATLDAVTRLRRAVYLHTYRLGSLAVRALGPAEAVGLFTRHVEAVGSALYVWLTGNFRRPVTVVLLVGIILAANFWLAVSFLSLVLLVWVVAGQAAAYFRRNARLATRRADAQLAYLNESMTMMRLVKTYQMERFNQNRVERQLAEHARANWRRLRGDAMSRPMLMAAATVAGVALLYLAGRSVLAGEFSVPGLVLTAATLAALVPAVDGWFADRRRLKAGRDSAAELFEFLDRRGEAPEAADAEFLPALSTRMEFRQITLKEPGTGRTIFENVSFAVPAGAKVAIVGPDEGAKRALMYLLPRFLDPTSGEIRIEDKNIRWVTHESLRAQVAVVMQDDLVFGDTVVNNIGCGDAAFNLPQVIEAAKVAHAHQFIEKLPYGYETLIGDQGHPLNPGERFRVALARAILRDPSILVIEEPTGPIDDDTLALLDDTLARIGPGRTILFLAHRLSTLRGVDRVFFLKDGQLEASGSHRDLWQGNEAYRRLQVTADAMTAEPV